MCNEKVNVFIAVSYFCVSQAFQKKGMKPTVVPGRIQKLAGYLLTSCQVSVTDRSTKS